MFYSHSPAHTFMHILPTSLEELRTDRLEHGVQDSFLVIGEVSTVDGCMSKMPQAAHITEHVRQRIQRRLEVLLEFKMAT